MGRLLTAVSLSMAIFCSTAVARIINIPADYSTIQAGIDASVNGDTVLVQPGTYLENINFNGRNIVLGSHYLTTGDTAFIASTIIDGDSAGTVITFNTAEDSTCLLTGFTVQHGYSNNAAGIHCENSSPLIFMNIIKDNWAGNWGGGIHILSSRARIIGNIVGNNIAAAGAGVSCHSSDAIFENNIIEDNTSRHGGAGIYCWGGRPVIRNNSILSNTCLTEFGGGVHIEETNAILCDDTISGNRAQRGAGIYCIGSAAPIISNCLIASDTASLEGGGIYCEFGADATIRDNEIRANVANSGAGICCRNGADAEIYGNDLSGNMASANGGGIACADSSRPVISNNVFVGNMALNGAAITCTNSFPVINNNTFYFNRASARGAAVYGEQFSIAITKNCILWQDSALSDPEVFFDSTCAYSIGFSDVEGGCPGEGNINTDPAFRDAGGGDFHLSAVACADSINSPCIDAGHPALIDSLLCCQWGLGGLLSDLGAYGGGEVGPHSGRTFFIPDDYVTIQAAICASDEGDTLLVRPGRYMENINFIGKEIIVGSLYFNTGDTSHISSTIIEGDSTNSVISFVDGEDSSSALIGFTIQTIETHQYRGSGIYCGYSSPMIASNIIKRNKGVSGGGICCYSASPLIQHNRIIGNQAAGYGGGIYCWASSPMIYDNVINGCYSTL